MSSKLLSVRKIAVGLLAATAAVVGVALASGPDDTVQAVSICSSSSGDLGGGGEYHPITPVRAFDSRVDRSKQPIGNGQTFSLPLSGVGEIPGFTDANQDGTDDNVIAVWANITTTRQSGYGYVQSTPTGTSFSTTAVVTFVANKTAPNSSLLRLGKDGSVDFSVTSSGSTHVVVDIFGFFSSCNYSRGARLIPVGPARILDTRRKNVPIGEAQTRAIQIRGADSFAPNKTDIIPNDPKVTAVVLNLSGVNTAPNAAVTYVSALPTPPKAGQLPTTANLNLQPGQVRGNLAIVPVGPDGKIYLFNRFGSTHVVADVVGYLRDGAKSSSTWGRVVPLAKHYRAIDTREKFSGGPKKLGPGQAETWSFEKMINSVKVGGEWVGAQAGMLSNFTAVDVSRVYPDLKIDGTYLSIYPPSRNDVPPFSNLNLGESEAVPNMALVRYGANKSIRSGNTRMCTAAHCAKVFNRHGYVHYVLDVQAVILK